LEANGNTEHFSSCSHGIEERLAYRYTQSRFRIDGVPIDHLKTPRDTGPLTWILSGKADLVADIRFPREPSDDVDLNAILGNIVDRFDEAVHSPLLDPLRPGSGGNGNDGRERIPGQPGLAVGKPLEAPGSMRRMLGLAAEEDRDARRVVSIDLDIRFKDLRAAVPVRISLALGIIILHRMLIDVRGQLFTPDLSYVNNALVRPIVAFINSNRTLIPIKCAVDLDLVSPCLYAMLRERIADQHDNEHRPSLTEAGHSMIRDSLTPLLVRAIINPDPRFPVGDNRG
jgi:hypothetical protein